MTEHDGTTGEQEIRAAAGGLDEGLFVPHLERLPVRLEELAAGAGGGDSYPDLLETICGAVDDSQPVESYNGGLGVTQAFVNAHQRPVAQFQWNDNLATLYTNPGNVNGARWGTGTMIAPDLILTAGHLFDQSGGGWERPRVNGTANIISPQEIATNMRVNFDFQADPFGNPRPEQSFAVTALLEYRLGGIDFAICRVAGSPGNTFGVTAVSTTDAAIGDMLAIIGHPAGLPKRIEAGPTTDVTGNLIRYNDIDTLGGNSGSGILQAATGRIVGVHTNGGCNSAGTGSNFGQRITVVRANSPVLQGLSTSTPIGDIATSLSADVLQTLASIDSLQTSIVRDRLTINLADAATRPSADIIRTRPTLDNFGTPAAADLVTTFAGNDAPGGGTFGGSDLLDPGGFGIDPVINPNPGVLVRPFVLATGHHAAVPAEFAQPEVAQPTLTQADYLSALAELDVALATQRQVLTELEIRYQQLAAEYTANFAADDQDPAGGDR